jgi:hypothetical protein
MTLDEIKAEAVQGIDNKIFTAVELVNEIVSMMQIHKECAIKILTMNFCTNLKIQAVSERLHYIEALADFLHNLGVNTTCLAILKDEMSLQNILAMLNRQDVSIAK